MQFDKHKKAAQILNEIDKNPENYLIVHYSCESFYNITDGHTPRITSIAVYSFSTAQTESFSIHKTAERERVNLEDIESRYDQLEKDMLDDFFQFVKEHRTMKWLHWNMRDINYGFKAIEHRFEVLGGKPTAVEDSCKIDISRLFIQCYGVNYIEHPRLESLIKLNGITAKDFLPGADEAKAFSNKEYIKLHQSTLRKVDVLANLLNRAIDRTLKVRTKWWQIYGLSPQGIYEGMASIWWGRLLLCLATLLVGAWLGKVL